MNFRSIFIFVLVSTVLLSCKNDTKQSEPEVITVEETSNKEPYKAADTKAEFNDPKVEEVYNRYIDLKTALVNTNSSDAAAAAEQLMTAFANVGVEEEALTAAQTMTEAGDDVEGQRVAFETVTKHVEAMLQGALKSGTIYKQFCPMAFDNKGAYWLSNSNEIYNPYFGDVMLRCGRVDSEIK